MAVDSKQDTKEQITVDDAEQEKAAWLAKAIERQKALEPEQMKQTVAAFAKQPEPSHRTQEIFKQQSAEAVAAMGPPRVYAPPPPDGTLIKDRLSGEVYQTKGGVAVPAPAVALKFDQDKPRPELLPTDVLMSVSKVLTYGAKKYADRNWEKGFSWSRLVGGLFRHLYSWVNGQRLDDETGLSHLDHALAMLMFLRAHELRQIGTDDMPQPKGESK